MAAKQSDKSAVSNHLKKDLKHMQEAVSHIGDLLEPGEDQNKHFAENTSLHGIRSIYDATSFWKLFWIITFLLIIGGCAVFPITMSIISYFSYTRSVDVNLVVGTFLLSVCAAFDLVFG